MEDIWTFWTTLEMLTTNSQIKENMLNHTRVLADSHSFNGTGLHADDLYKSISKPLINLFDPENFLMGYNKIKYEQKHINQKSPPMI